MYVVVVSIVVYNVLDRERLGGLNWLSLLNFYVYNRIFVFI